MTATNPISIAIVIASAAALIIGPTATHAQERPIKAVGRAVGDSLQAKDQALADAKRNAVEMACGTIINAQSQVEDFQLKKDRILGQAVGYITGYKVLREWVDADITHCEISATVSVGKFKSDWEAMFAHIKEGMQNPRCMIVITEDNDVDDANPAKTRGICQTEIERFFLANNVQLIDKTVSDSVRQRDLDLALANDDYSALAARAAEFKADVLIIGQAEAKRGETITVGGHTLHRWNITLNIRVIQADSARLLTTGSYTPEKPYRTAHAGCGDDAFTQLISDVSERLLRDVGEAWRKRLTSHHHFTVDFEGCSRKEFRKTITPALLKIQGVQQGDEGVKLREAVNNIVSAEIYWSFNLDNLADALDELRAEGFTFEVTEQTANRLRCKVIRTQ